MPTPLSLIVSVPAAASGISSTHSSSPPISSGLAIASKRSLSQASDAFEINSRRKISLFEYSEWIIKCRSEEHTSELQSLMRISYAVFCLQKKKKNTCANSTTQLITIGDDID